MSPGTVLRPPREDELSAVLRLWQDANVTPPSTLDAETCAAVRDPFARAANLAIRCRGLERRVPS